MEEDAAPWDLANFEVQNNQWVSAHLKTFAGKFHEAFAQYYENSSCVDPFRTATTTVEECFAEFR